jgi:glycine dehydrogenase
MRLFRLVIISFVLVLTFSTSLFYTSEIVMPTFADRHIGLRNSDIQQMLATLGHTDLDSFVEAIIPPSIRTEKKLNVPTALSEEEALATLRSYADQNEIWRSYIGLGYHNCHTPTVILRNLLENPGWYTSYTPYQAEISQGRLEGLLIFQTMLQDLTGMEISNSSLLDEATAAAEAMTMMHRVSRGKQGNRFFVASSCHPQSIRLMQNRAEPLGIEIIVGDPFSFDFATKIYGAMLQYPCTDGSLEDYTSFVDQAHQHKALVAMATDILALTLLKEPSSFGVDVVVGNTQRFGVPLGYGGPHAAFLATKDAYKRQMPGRIIGVSRDAEGNPALRMALQTREQHIRRQKATSNICTAQALLANVAAMYAVWHGPKGLREIAQRIADHAHTLAKNLKGHGFSIRSGKFFDTICLDTPSNMEEIQRRLEAKQINLFYIKNEVHIALDETVTNADVQDIFSCFVPNSTLTAHKRDYGAFARQSDYLTHHFFNTYHSETEMMRYLHKLETRDLALNTAMIPLGSCTMKLNAATEMIPITWPEFSALHPYAPSEQAKGYAQLFCDLQEWLADITGFDAISLQPNAGSQGEYAGLLSIRSYHQSRGDHDRNICLIPTSAHGTNPASAIMAGMKVVPIQCDSAGNIDMDDLKAKAERHSEHLAALMVTYPSTHGVFEETIKEVCSIIHTNGGQVYLDGANMNAIVGLCRPGELGADVCHLNLHKTFCIPHGGGGPGMGPIGVKEHLRPFLPGNPIVEEDVLPISAAPFGSPSILPISWAYIAMCGPDGLTKATQIAILSANYLAARLREHYPILYTGKNGFIAHECILDVRHFKDLAGVSVDDIAKRLIDYGFHAPTMSWPVAGTLMVEPTESEPLSELERFIEAMIAIRTEIQAVQDEDYSYEESPLHNAPHTAAAVTAADWNLPYSRQDAVFPTAHTLKQKYWPPVRRVDNVYGDRNLACSCMSWVF